MDLEKFGVFSNSYMYNDDYDVTEEPGTYSIDRILKGVSKAGFRYIELLAESDLSHVVPNIYEMDHESSVRFKSKLDKYDLKLSGIYYYQGNEGLFTYSNGLKKIKRIIDGCSLLSSGFLITDADYLDDKAKQKLFYKNIVKVLDYAASKNLILCLDIHGNWICNGKSAADIIEKISHPNLKINYCTGNAIYWGNSRPEEDIDNALPFLGRVHLKDSMGKLKDYNFPALGDGTIDFRNILLKLEDFKGPISVEVELDGKDDTLKEINDAISKSRNFLKKIIA